MLTEADFDGVYDVKNDYVFKKKLTKSIYKFPP